MKVRQILGTKQKKKTDHQKQKCYACNDAFKGRAIPELCQKCQKTFHKRCISGKLHQCNAFLVVATAQVPPTSVNRLTFTTVTSTKTCTTLSSQSHEQVPNSVSNPVLQSTGASSSALENRAGTEINDLQRDSASNPELSQRHTLNPDALPFYIKDLGNNIGGASQQTSSSGQQTGNPGPQASKSRQKKPPKNCPATDPASIEAEFKNIQLNAAQARILELETDVKRLKQSNSILEERIKIFEENRRKGIHEQYFRAPAQESSSTPHPSNCNHSYYPNFQHHLHCHHLPPGCFMQPTSNLPCPNSSRIDTISSKIAEIAQNMEAFKITLDHLKTSGQNMQVNTKSTNAPTSKPLIQPVSELDENNVDSDDSFDVEMTDDLN